MKRYLRRVLAGTALVIILVMLGGSLAAFAGVSVSAAREEFTHTDAKPYSRASSQSFFISSAVAAGFRLV